MPGNNTDIAPNAPNLQNDVIIADTDNLLARIKATRVSLVLAALGFAPLLGLFFIASWDRPAYQFFPLALAGAALLGWRALREGGPRDYRTTDHGLPTSALRPPPSPPSPAVSSPVVRSPDSASSSSSSSSSLVVPQPSAGRPLSDLRSPISAPLPRPVVRSPVVRSLPFALAFLVANALWSPWLGYVAFLLGLVALLWSLGGKSLAKACVPAILILLTILPPPLNGDVTLTVWLRTVAVHTSSVLLDWLQVTHAQDGNTLLLPGKTLLVEEACSGINSFILCNALCLFWGLWQRRSLLWFVFALPATSLFVVQGNILRITLGAAAFYFHHWDLLSGRPHEIFGLVLLLGYCVLILSFDQFLVFLTHRRRPQPPSVAASRESAADSRPPSAADPTPSPVGAKLKIEDGGSKMEGTEGTQPFSILPSVSPPPLNYPPSSINYPPPPTPGSPISAHRPPPTAHRPSSSLAVPESVVSSPVVSSLSSALLALIGLAFFAAHLFLGGRHGLVKLPNLSSVRELNLSLPANVAGWQRTSANAGDPSWAQTYGFRSANWQFQHNGVTATVAADYPLDGFHNVKGCYLANGWGVLGEKELLLPPGGEDLHALKLDLQKSLQFAVVLHSVVNGEGQWLAAPLSVTSRFQADLGPPQKGYRVQMITVSYGPLSPAVEADCQSLFLQARQLLVRQLVDQLQTTSAK